MDMIIQIQNTDVDTAASAVGPRRVPTQNASTLENSVISSVDATGGSATRTIVRGSGRRREPPARRARP